MKKSTLLGLTIPHVHFANLQTSHYSLRKFLIRILEIFTRNLLIRINPCLEDNGLVQQ